MERAVDSALSCFHTPLSELGEGPYLLLAQRDSGLDLDCLLVGQVKALRGVPPNKLLNRLDLLSPCRWIINYFPYRIPTSIHSLWPIKVGIGVLDLWESRERRASPGAFGISIETSRMHFPCR